MIALISYIASRFVLKHTVLAIAIGLFCLTSRVFKIEKNHPRITHTEKKKKLYNECDKRKILVWQNRNFNDDVGLVLYSSEKRNDEESKV